MPSEEIKDIALNSEDVKVLTYKELNELAGVIHEELKSRDAQKPRAISVIRKLADDYSFDINLDAYLPDKQGAPDPVNGSAKLPPKSNGHSNGHSNGNGHTNYLLAPKYSGDKVQVGVAYRNPETKELWICKLGAHRPEWIKPWVSTGRLRKVVDYYHTNRIRRPQTATQQASL